MGYRSAAYLPCDKKGNGAVAFVDMVNNSTNITGVTFNDLGTNEFKTISEDGTIEFAIGQLTADDFLAKLSAAMK